MSGKNRTLIFIVILIAVIGAGVLVLSRQAPEPLIRPPESDNLDFLGPAPDFTVELLDGGTKRVKDYRGQTLIVNFWASWCPPCRAEAPDLVKVSKKYENKVRFLGIIYQDREEDARAFIKEFGIPYENGFDPDGRSAQNYKITGVPTTFIIDTKGRLRIRWLGAIGEEQLSAYIDAALAE